jgi:hypothetical protein
VWVFTVAIGDCRETRDPWNRRKAKSIKHGKNRRRWRYFISGLSMIQWMFAFDIKSGKGVVYSP